MFFNITQNLSDYNYRKSCIKHPLSNKRLPLFEPFCTKRPSLMSVPLNKHPLPS